MVRDSPWRAHSPRRRGVRREIAARPVPSPLPCFEVLAFEAGVTIARLPQSHGRARRVPFHQTGPTPSTTTTACFAGALPFLILWSLTTLTSDRVPGGAS